MPSSRAKKRAWYLTNGGGTVLFYLLLCQSPVAFAADNELLIREWHQQQAEKRIAIDRLDVAKRRVLLLGELQRRLQHNAWRYTNGRVESNVDEWCQTYNMCSPLVQSFFARHALYIAGEILSSRSSYRRPIDPAKQNQSDEFTMRTNVAQQIITTVADAANSNDWLMDEPLNQQLQKIVKYPDLDSRVQAIALNALRKQYRLSNQAYEQALKNGEQTVDLISKEMSWSPIPLSCSQKSKDVTARMEALMRERNLVETNYKFSEPSGYAHKVLGPERNARLRAVLGTLKSTFHNLSESEKAYFYSRTVTMLGGILRTDMERSAVVPFYDELLDAVSVDWPHYNANSIALLGSSAGLWPGGLAIGIKAHEKALVISRFSEDNLFSDANHTEGLGYLYVLNGEYQKAKECFETATRIESELPNFLITNKNRNIARRKCWLDALSEIQSDDKCASGTFVIRHTKKTTN